MLFPYISPKKFHECFINWIRDRHSSEAGCVITIDGTTLRGAYDKNRRRSVIGTFCATDDVVFGQLNAVEKSNEITATSGLINLLDIIIKIIISDTLALLSCQPYL